VAGASTFFESYRPLFLIVAAVLLGIGFYLNYRPQKTACGPDGECTTSNIRLRRLNRGMLWTSAALVAALAMFPSYAGRILGASSTSAETAETRFIVLDIEGMTCAGCEVAVATSLSELPEVVSAEVSYEDGQAVVQLAGGVTPDRTALTAAVGKAGYTLASVSEAEAEPAPGLTGHWTTEVQNGEGETLEITMDLGRVNSRWVGEFDLLRYEVTNYPVEVSSVEPIITLYLTAMGMEFEGTLSGDGQTLQGKGRTGDEWKEIVFSRTGGAEFSEDFLELESAADDPSLVEILTSDAAALRERFNADADKTRLLMLLAPT
jgi:copper chaperone CopZ